MNHSHQFGGENKFTVRAFSMTNQTLAARDIPETLEQLVHTRPLYRQEVYLGNHPVYDDVYTSTKSLRWRARFFHLVPDTEPQL